MSARLKDIYARPAVGKLTADEFTKAMIGLGLTDDVLAKDIGTRVARVAAWRHGTEEVPRTLALLLAAWTVPGALTRSRNAAQFLDERAAGAQNKMQSASVDIDKLRF